MLSKRPPLLAVIRSDTPEEAVERARAVYAGGFRLIEITTTVPQAPDVIRELVGLTGALIGGGTITNLAQADDFLAAGAQFLVSPINLLKLVDVARAAGVPCVVGGMTPTEIHAAWQAGADLVKVFPVRAVGGLVFLKDLHEPFPELPLLVSGGIDPQNYLGYLRSGARLVSFGGYLWQGDPQTQAAGLCEPWINGSGT